MENLRFKIEYAPCPNAPDMTAFLYKYAVNEAEARALFFLDSTVPAGSSIKRITPA